MTQEIRNDPDETEKQNENTVQMTYDPTHDDVSEIGLVGGTDESYESLKIFEKAWNYDDNYLRSKSRDTMKKELKNMEQNKVW